ncbi:hypothetical protein K431DRAFT_268606 [Polychaeton citri CBS 116435]|uniref:4'-phosphopantetheinyl transferase domain-containing protein n=1 Tax=Polychaeton citri CBS 116435 TaxID=1314669 RepID=A0A9P4UQ40_9PEZI|nr:hypothetical protein K431DRAFT_268606 [Polychaeton citri CBS 116435]
MPIRPFPLPMTVGTDICNIPRVLKLITKQKHGSLNSFLRRLLSPREQDAFSHRFGAIDTIFLEAKQTETSKAGVVARHLAGRWAAKEAVIKAYGSQGRRLSFWDILITANAAVQSERSEPVTCLVLDSRAEHFPANRCSDTDEISQFRQRDGPVEAALHGQVVRISISHDSEYATAVCIAPLEPAPGDVGGEAAARALY